MLALVALGREAIKTTHEMALLVGRRLPQILLAGSAAIAFAAPTLAAGSQLLSATVVPADMALTPHSSATGLLLLVNSGTTPANTVHVDALAAANSIVVNMPTTDTTVPAGGSTSLDFTVNRISEGTGQDVVIRFVVTYSQAADAQSPSISQTVVTSLIAKAVASPALVEAKIESNVTSINENRPGEGALVVTNPRDTKITIQSIQVSAPDAVEVILDCPGGGQLKKPGVSTSKCQFNLDPRSQQMLVLRLTTTDSVAPGPRLVVVRVTALDPDTATSASAVATEAFTLDVFAESDILKSIGVPIFLLMPGVIIVVVFWGLLSLFGPWKKQAGSTNAIGAATFGAVAGLGISLLVGTIAYPFLTLHVWPQQERNYLKAYGFRDFYYAFVISFAIAIVAWIVAWMISRLHRRYLVPTSDDEPVALFRKLVFRGLLRRDTRFRRVNVKEKGKGLQVSRSPGGGWMIVPTLEVSFPKETPSGLLARIESEATAGESIRLWRTVNAARRDNKAVLSYRPGDLQGPLEEIDESKLERSAQHGAIVEVAPLRGPS